MPRPVAPMYMVRHAVRDQLLEAAQALADDRIGDAEALTSTSATARAVLATIARLRVSPAPAVSIIA